MAAATLVIATTNAGKLREFRQLLGGLGLDLAGLADFGIPPSVVEDGATYADNARLKALTMARWCGRPALADDSGLEVDALGGAPGVHSARYAGTEQDSAANIAKLLGDLAATPPARRTARFRCVIAVARPDGALLSAEGVCEGLISGTPSGGGGFGYDPIFFYPPSGMTFAEMPAVEKQRVSHRARACEGLKDRLVDFLRAASIGEPGEQ